MRTGVLAFGLALLGAGCLTPGILPAQSASEARANASEPPRLTDEVIVTRRRITALEKETHQAQEDLYKAFNANNDDHELDMRCYREVPINSHISRRVCRPAFVDSATMRASQDFMWYLKGQCADGSDGNCMGAALETGGGKAQEDLGNLKFMAKKLDSAMARLIRENPEVAKAYAKYLEKERTYQDALGRRGK